MSKLNFPIHFVKYNFTIKIDREGDSLNIERITYQTEDEFLKSVQDGTGVFDHIYIDQKVKEMFIEFANDDNLTTSEVIKLVECRNWGSIKYKCFQNHQSLEIIDFFQNY